jgi:hypothetical protein
MTRRDRIARSAPSRLPPGGAGLPTSEQNGPRFRPGRTRTGPVRRQRPSLPAGTGWAGRLARVAHPRPIPDPLPTIPDRPGRPALGPDQARRGRRDSHRGRESADWPRGHAPAAALRAAGEVAAPVGWARPGLIRYGPKTGRPSTRGRVELRWARSRVACPAGRSAGRPARALRGIGPARF